MDPKDISKDFAHILKDEIVGINTDVICKVSKAFKFRNEEKEFLKDDESEFFKTMGNVTVATKI